MTGDFSFDVVWERRVPTTTGGASLCTVGLGDPIALKQAAGRPRDLVAVEDLKKRREQIARERGSA